MKNRDVKRGRGRPKIGEQRSVTIVLPDTEWLKVDSLVSSGYASSTSDYFRQVHEKFQSRIGK